MFIKNIYLAYVNSGKKFLLRKFSSQNINGILHQDFRSYTCRSVYFSKIQKDAFSANIKRNMSAVTDANQKDKMNAWLINKLGIENAQLTSTSIPSLLRPSDVLIKVTAASVNPLDILMLEDTSGSSFFDALRDLASFEDVIRRASFPLTVGRDFAGEVVSVGHSVSDIKVDDKVWGVVLPQYQGCHAQYVVANSCVVCPKPENISDVEAASIPFVGLTAWQAAVCTAGLIPNKCHQMRILIVGASGGVGSFLTQLLSFWGAEVVAVCSESSFDMVLSCGASAAYDYRDDGTLEKLSSQKKFHIVFDAGEGSNKWLSVMKYGTYGCFISFKSPLLTYTDRDGVLLGTFKTFAELLQQNMVNLPQGYVLKWAFFYPDKEALNYIGKLLSQKKIRPVIDKVYKIEEAKAAYEHVKDGPRRGKIVIDFTS